MGVLPYRWQHDRPAHVVPRPSILGPIETALRQGLAVKLIGGRGMGKSVLLWQIQQHFAGEPETRVVLIPGPPTESTVAGCLRDLADRLALALPRLTPDALMTAADRELGIRRLIVLIDEVDQYVLADGTGALARSWFNRLESLRKSWIDRFAVVIAGGLGLLHVSHVLGSGLLSRAETCLAAPFDRTELDALAAPLRARSSLEDGVLETLAALSGGIPALATYGLECLWSSAGDPMKVPMKVLRDSFGAFPVRHADFLKAIQDGVSYRGLVGAPGRVLQVVRESPGSVAQTRLRDACVGDDPPIDTLQAVQLLQAAGLVRLRAPIHSDPLDIHPNASIIHLPTVPATGADPLERFALDMARMLAHLHRFGRDFHGDKGLLEESVFSSLLAVGLGLLHWENVVREPVQAAGFPDLRVGQSGLDGHILIEVKFWPENNYKTVEAQLDEYRVSETVLAAVVMIGVRKESQWADDYERKCLHPGTFTRQPTPPDLVGWWRVEREDAQHKILRTDHFLVQIPKRD